MGENARLDKYAEALGGSRVNYRLASLLTGDEIQTAARAVMAVADAELDALGGALNHERDVACTSIQRQRVAEQAELRAEVERLRNWQREVCDLYGYDAGEDGAADEVLTYLPAWKAENRAERDALREAEGESLERALAAEASVARVEALLPCAADGCPCGADRVAVPVKDVRIALDPSCDTVWGAPYNHDEMATLAGPAD